MLAALVGCASASGGGSGGGSAAGSPEERPRAETTATSGTVGTAEREGEAVGVEGMSVRDLVGQMFVVSMSGTEPDYYIEKMIRERNIG